MVHKLTCIIVGGGAAGYFAAINTAQTFPQHRVILLEKTRQPLAKVRISGGGRCNVTHSCFEPSELIKNYPRGGKELRGPFSRFQPKDTIEWFHQRGVQLKVEEDGRMFPVTDSSETIIDCLTKEALKSGVEINLECGIEEIHQKEDGYLLKLTKGTELTCHRLLLATGSAHKIYPLLEQLGHTIIPLVPSLFTFNTPSSQLLDLAGVSVAEATVKLPQMNLEQCGPLLITHWGFSGPAILKLSAWGARELNELDYKAKILINWLPSMTENELKEKIQRIKAENTNKQIGTESFFGLPKQLWKRLITLSQNDCESRWATLSNKQIQQLTQILSAQQFNMEGKTTYKQEFVTCGGICLKEVDFKTMQSKCSPNLFFAGEILDIDGITGGFNFQNAWTTGWIASQAIG